MLDNCVSDNDHILSLTLLLINILYIIYVLDSFAWISLINVCMYNGSLSVGLGLISHVLLQTNFHYLKARKKVTLDQLFSITCTFFRNLKNTFNWSFTGSRLHNASLSIFFNAKAQFALVK